MLILHEPQCNDTEIVHHENESTFWIIYKIVKSRKCLYNLKLDFSGKYFFGRTVGRMNWFPAGYTVGLQSEGTDSLQGVQLNHSQKELIPCRVYSLK